VPAAPRRYRVDLTTRAARDLANLPRPVQQKVVDTIDRLATVPRPPGSKKLKGEDGFHRVRVGDYRIIYSIDDKVVLVLVVRIGNRREVYR
jgi:mRNA interferase RelE/StbE